MAINRTLLLLGALGLATAGSALLRACKGPPPGEIVIGEELAAARAADRLHSQSRDSGDSPLPAQRYEEVPARDFDWMDPRPVPLDSAIAQVVRRYAAAGPAERDRMRDAINMDGLYELRTFASRAALFALRERSERHLRDGLAAVAMLEPTRMDPRDIPGPVAELHHAAVRMGADAGALFRQAGALAQPEVGALIAGFPARPAEEKDLRTSWLLEEVQFPGGPVLLQRMLDPYEPTRDMVPLMVDLARVFAADQYRPGAPILASTLPAVWLRGAGGREIEQAVERIRAGATLHANLRPGAAAEEMLMPLMVFVNETAAEADARTLEDASRRVRPRRGTALLGVAEGRYFVLVVDSQARDARTYENPERLARFAAPLREALRRHAAQP